MHCVAVERAVRSRHASSGTACAQIAGTAVHNKSESNGFIKVFDVELASAAGKEGTADCVFHVSVVPGNSAVCVAWHPEINHIAVGGGDCVTHVLYDPTLSKKGCLMSSIRAPKR